MRHVGEVLKSKYEDAQRRVDVMDRDVETYPATANLVQVGNILLICICFIEYHKRINFPAVSINKAKPMGQTEEIPSLHYTVNKIAVAQPL